MDFEISSPWGTITSKCENISTKIVFQGLKQLMQFYNQGNHTDYIKADIKAYKMLLDSSKQEHNCDKFLEVKHKALEIGDKFENNLTIINFMKENNLWEN